MEIFWDQKFEIGHERIDFEHRIFLGLIADLDTAVSAGASKERLSRITREVEAYARFHFLSEENIMIDAGYPDYDAHRCEHKRLLALLEDRAYSFLHDELNPLGLVTFLFEWFALHTIQVDKKLGAFLRERDL